MCGEQIYKNELKSSPVSIIFSRLGKAVAPATEKAWYSELEYQAFVFYTPDKLDCAILFESLLSELVKAAAPCVPLVGCAL